MTAADIASALASYIGRNDAESNGAQANSLALGWLAVTRQLFVREGLAIVTLAIVDGAAPLPADFGKADRVTVQGRGQLNYVPPGEYADLTASNALEYQFSVIGPQLVMSPAITSAVLLYFTKPAQPTGSASNWLTEVYPDVWLHAALAEQYRFLQDAQAANLEDGHWQGLAAAAVSTSSQVTSAGGALRMKGR